MREASDLVINSSFRLSGFGALLGKITPRTDLYADQALDIWAYRFWWAELTDLRLTSAVWGLIDDYLINICRWLW